MKLRDFLKVLPLVPFGDKALNHAPALPPPISEFPNKDKIVGMWVQAWNRDTKNWSCPPYLVTREFDDLRDNPYQGQQITNCWQNKYWGKPMTGGPEVLLCFDRWDHDLRFFKNTSSDWSLIGQGILW